MLRLIWKIKLTIQNAVIGKVRLHYIDVNPLVLSDTPLATSSHFK